ncbi:hypothetical protein ABPG75_007444 [Micractinium tetrahymenae]
MDGASTLEQIEADLRFCEDVLNSKAKSQPWARQRPSSAGPAAPQPKPQQQRAPRGPAAAPPAQPPPAARTTEELLAMLSSVPEGQPFEIDTRLLYSPQSSVSGEALRSAAGGADSQGDSPASTRTASLDGFSLPAYRRSTDGRQPLFADLGQAATALSPLRHQRGSSGGGGAGLLSPGGDGHRRSQQHAAGPRAGQQQQQQQQGGGRGGRQPAGHGPRPASAPLRPGSAGGARPARQLLLDDVAERGVQGRTAELLRLGQEGRLQHLVQPRTALWQRCAEIKVLEEQEQLQECTFAPKTGRPPSRHRLAPGLPVEERLQLAQAGREEALERARLEREQEALAACTFAPRLVTQPERLLQAEYTPPHRRLGEEARRRSTKLAQARLQAGLADADLTFQPQLNPRSLKMAAEKEERDLYSEPGARGRPNSAPRSDGDSSACTFAPAINRTSERLLEDSSTVPTDFQERLRYYSLRRQAKEAAAQAAADADACTFRPDTGNAVQVLALSASRAGNLLESPQERYERLALEEAARRTARRAAKEAEVYGSLEFRPQLNPRSLAMAPGGSGGVEALASAEKKRRKLEELRRAEEERRRAECTFRPDTSKPRVKGYYDEYQPPAANAVISISAAAKQGFEGLTQRITDYQAEREARAAAARAAEEEHKLKECSFTPDINRRRVEAKGPVMVRGLDRVLELKQLAERQKAEAAERAARVFNANPRAKQGATVPKPFQLAGHALLEAKAADKQAARLESMMVERARDCPFRPQTNHQRRQEQLGRILAQPSYSEAELMGLQQY